MPRMMLPRGLVPLDLFPDEAHVRLRSRVHGTYLHADEDGAGVSLRAHGSVPSRNDVWRVRRLPIGAFLLQSTALGSYLAVSRDPAPPGFGGCRAVLCDYDGEIHELSPAEDIVWRPAMPDAEGDDTFVFLRHMMLNLRASGNHRIWHTSVTVASVFNNNASSTPMRAHWAVEIIPRPAPNPSLTEEKNNGFAYSPSTKEQIAKTENKWASLETDNLPSSAKLSGKEFQPTESELQASSILIEEKNIGENQWASLEMDSLPTPAKLSGKEFQPRSDTCLACSKDSNNCLCNECRRRMKTAVLKARGAPLGAGSFYLCLKCLDLVRDDHGDGAHKTQCIPLDTVDGSQVAWVNQKETWCAIFAGIQSDRNFKNTLGRPFLLHSPQGWRCDVCADYLSEDKLFETALQFCSIQCWAHKAEVAPEFSWVKALLKSDFNRPGKHCYFCNVCRCVFNELEIQFHLHELEVRVFNELEVQHQLHKLEVQGLRMITYFMGGTTAVKIEVPSDHFMASYWISIKNLSGGGNNISSPTHLFRLRSEREQRCRECKMRLEDGGGRVCSLECNLYPVMLPRQSQMLRMQKSNAA